MIAAGVRIEGFAPNEVAALFRLLTEPPAGARIGDPRHGAVVLLEGDRPRALLLPMRGGLAPLPRWIDADRPIDPADLRRLRRETGATWAIACGAALVRRLEAALGRAYGPDADLLGDLWPLVAEIREARRAGELLFSPALLDGVPIPPESAVRAAVEVLFPEGSSVVLCVFDAAGLVFGGAALRRDREVVRVSGPADWGLEPPRGGPWRASVPRILDAVRRAVGPPSLGVFVEATALRGIVFGAAGGGLARALATRTLVFDPLPSWLAVVIGADAAARAAGEAGRLLRRLDPLGIADRIDLGGMAGRLGERIGREVPWRKLLGFDPFELLARLQRWDD